MIHTIFPTSSFILKTHNNLHLQIPTARNVNGKRAVLRSNDPAATTIDSASCVVTKFYDGINRRDLALVEEFIAQNCVYEDLIFPKPFVGRKAILEFFDKFVNTISSDLQFAIDDISEEDSSAVGVAWHLGNINLGPCLQTIFCFVLPSSMTSLLSQNGRGKPFLLAKVAASIGWMYSMARGK